MSAHGLSVRVPRGWHAQIYRRDQEGPRSRVGGTGTTNAVLHVANFAINDDIADYATGAHRRMGTGGVAIALVEFDFEAAATEMFNASGVPRQLNSNAFSPSVMPQPVPPLTGFQWFGHEADRAFSLLVVLGSHRLRHLLTAEVNRILPTLLVE
jgi:hypothetical protein